MTKRELISSSVVERRLPLNYVSMASGKESFIRPRESFGSINLYEIENAYVSSKAVVFQGGRVIPESVYGMFEPRKQWTGFVKKIVTRNVRSFSEPSLVAHHPFFDNYFHWLCEIMPRLFVSRDTLRETSLLMHERMPGFVKEFLSLFEYRKLISIKEDELLKVRQLYFPSHIARPLAYNESVMRDFSGWLQEKLDDPSSVHGPDKLFISRKNARYRITYNEERIETFLESRGFTTVTPELLSVRGQMNLFKHARMIVGSHGAGFSNLIFAPRCELIVDIIHKEHPQDCFYNLANVFGTQYYYFQCEGKGTLEFKNNDDVIADPDEFEEKVGPLLV